VLALFDHEQAQVAQVAVGRGRKETKPVAVDPLADCFLIHETEDLVVPPIAATAPVNLGYLTVLQEGNGYLGGYLVTNAWGRPLEFRLSTAVQPTRVQQILYGGMLQPYICADLIGKTLVEKTSVPVQVIITDREAILDLRLKIETPVLWLAPPDATETKSAEHEVFAATATEGPAYCHPAHIDDVKAVRKLLANQHGSIDLAEPFTRIREAIAEARKSGAARRDVA
jgi:hypothetical protein